MGLHIQMSDDDIGKWVSYKFKWTTSVYPGRLILDGSKELDITAHEDAERIKMQAMIDNVE